MSTGGIGDDAPMCAKLQARKLASTYSVGHGLIKYCFPLKNAAAVFFNILGGLPFSKARCQLTQGFLLPHKRKKTG